MVAVHAILQRKESFTMNLGTDNGHSVLEVICAFKAKRQNTGYLFSLSLDWYAIHKLPEMYCEAGYWQQSYTDGNRC